MDITKELRSLAENKICEKELLRNIESEQDELKKKLYLFKVIFLAEKLEELVSTKSFQETEIAYIEIATRFDQFNKESFGTYPRYLNKSKTQFITKRTNALTNIELINDMFDGVSKVDFKLVNERLVSAGNKELEPKSGIGNEILDIFLSDELKSIYKYNKMDMDLPHNDIRNGKRLKV